MKTFAASVFCVLLCFCSFALADTASSVSQYGITWTFDGDYQVGQFVTGDWWVVGPVNVIGISNDLHDAGFTPGDGDDGSMLNPAATTKQGYDSALNSYDASLNAGRPNGQPVSASNPLAIATGSSLVSMVSWLYNSETDTEVGCPGFNGGTHAPRPVTRSGAILTVLAEPAAAGSFRPAYCGSGKTVKFNVSQINLNALQNLPPTSDTPDPAALRQQIQRPWIDHVHEYLGAMVHPSQNMPNYGREIAKIMAQVALMINVDFSQLSGSSSKTDLLIPYLQFGIDCAGIADVGGGWPENGGHGPGRKLPILIAGSVLGDSHMINAGQWSTEFHDDMQTFYVTQAEVDITHSASWNPDSRAADKEPYEPSDIGMAEWGIRHTKRPTADNRGWRTTYRDVNGAVIPATALAACISGVRQAWNHEAYFDYAVRYMDVTDGGGTGTNSPPAFAKAMWQTYGNTYMVMRQIPGDANEDGTVDLDDFIILKQNYGEQDASWSQGDFNEDGVVDLDDFILLKQNYGNGA